MSRPFSFPIAAFGGQSLAIDPQVSLDHLIHAEMRLHVRLRVASKLLGKFSIR
jgi:hypothetical protein